MTVRLLDPLRGAGRLTDPYGPRKAIPGTVGAQLHTGADLAAPALTPIYAAHAGRITRVWWDTMRDGSPAGGNMTELAAAGYATRYAHADHYVVNAGTEVGAGDLIGYVGATGAATGAHLHFELLLNGQFTDPMPYIKPATLPADLEGMPDMFYLILQKRHTYLVIQQGNAKPRGILLGAEATGKNRDPQLPVIHASSADFTMGDLKRSITGLRTSHLKPVK